jgi:hypothetical protein
MKNYKFEVLCKSGQVKVFECTAQNFREARKLLEDFIQAN